MDKAAEFLFNPEAYNQADEPVASGFTSQAEQVAAREHSTFDNIHSDAVNYASTSFTVLIVNQGAVSSQTSQETKMAFPSRKISQRTHLAPVSRLCVICEWNASWFTQDDADLIGDLYCYDGFDYHQNKIYTSDCIATDRVLIYRTLAFGLAGTRVKFAAVDDEVSTLAISLQGESILSVALYRCGDVAAAGGYSKFEIPGKIITLAFKQQLLSWTFNSRLIDGLVHLSKAVDEVEATALRSAAKWDEEREKLLSAATALINSKKQEIARLLEELNGHRSDPYKVEPTPAPPERKRAPKKGAATRKSTPKRKPKASKQNLPPTAISSPETQEAVDAPTDDTPDSGPVCEIEAEPAVSGAAADIDLFSNWGADDSDN